MENFVVSARKYRPATFRSVVGQQHVTTTLQNAIVTGHLAQAFLFCGPRGVGKTTCARILAKTINCTNLTPEAEACDQCDSCRAFNQSASFNVHELDAASNNSVEDIRSLVEQVRYAPQAGRYKVYIIDEVHMLSNAAFNAFLKTLEEPPGYAIFILATTERHKIIPTILSRCQIFDFNRIKLDDIVGHLAYVSAKEEVTAEEDALHLIAQKADGGLRDALSIFDQMVTFSGHQLSYRAVVQNLHVLDYEYYFRLTEACLTQNLTATLLLLDEVVQNGFDLHQFVVGAAEHLRGLLVSKDPQTVQLLEVSEGLRQRYVDQARQAPLSFLVTGLNLLSQCDRDFKAAKNQRLHVELVLMKLAYLRNAVQLTQDLVASAGSLVASSDNGEAKKKTNGVAHAAPAAVAPLAAPASAGPRQANGSAAYPANGTGLNGAVAHDSASAYPQPNGNGTQAHAPAAPEPIVPVQSGVAEMHPTPSIETEQEERPSTKAQLVDTLPHVAAGRPSVAGHEPGAPTLVAEAHSPIPGAARPAPKPIAIPKMNLQAVKAQATQKQEAAAVVVEEEADGPVTGHIDNAVLQRVWAEIAEERKVNSMSEYLVLNRPVHADEQHTIQLHLDNGVQMDQFNAFRPELLLELKRRTGYRTLRLAADVVESAPTVKRLYTSTDKFAFLADKYPVLMEMKQRLGLDTDF
ncbi:DNA polymerase III subunit gamma/tau [Hymenobacter busanensis]|uniref:DNA polymerase III subunit gamma/tau n=1 Tax=Hymenobacter busanensis TaxID=2607656 RepID=A0A7L4ZWI9_9BACT|nr:DNA polymerase III subunit gamma/tau [Hymenobacter busanensis]KAA9332071.1 DNA polymerase III subunit gamma/tau [Hymenobacter busanensis]QHJ07591.1 DNA polymerase III subunit gamma/tau [Hymenobacter busanensis]